MCAVWSVDEMADDGSQQRADGTPVDGGDVDVPQETTEVSADHADGDSSVADSQQPDAALDADQVEDSEPQTDKVNPDPVQPPEGDDASPEQVEEQVTPAEDPEAAVTTDAGPSESVIIAADEKSPLLVGGETLHPQRDASEDRQDDASHRPGWFQFGTGPLGAAARAVSQYGAVASPAPQIPSAEGSPVLRSAGTPPLYRSGSPPASGQLYAPASYVPGYMSNRRRSAMAPRHDRQASHEIYARTRRRTRRKPSGPDTTGDFVIHDFLNERTRSHLLEAEERRAEGHSSERFSYVAKIYLLLLILGLGAGSIAAGLDLVVDWLSDLKFGTCRRGWYVSRAVCCRSAGDVEDCEDFLEWGTLLGENIPVVRQFLPDSWAAFGAYTVFACCFGAVSAFLVKRFAPYAAGSGVPEIKTVLSGVELKGYLGVWPMLIKIIGLGFSVSSGLNLGKEGPFVHLASALAYVLAVSVEDIQDDFNLILELVTAGTAAGVSVAFNAPIGGVLFAFEEAANFFPNHVLWRSFFASAIAALTLKILNPFLNGRAVIFEIDHGLEWFWFEMILFFAIGAIGGIVGAIFIKYNVMYSRYRIRSRWFQRNPIMEVVYLILATSALSYGFGFLRLSNTEILTTLFAECPEMSQVGENRASVICNTGTREGLMSLFGVLFYAAVTKIFLTILTFGTRVPAGLFIPSMTIGACIGRMIGAATRELYLRYPDAALFRECATSSVCVRPSIYALIGASSVLAGVTQVSVSLVVIMFELTGGLSHLLPTIVGTLAAKMVCNYVGFEGIYDNHILIKRYPYLSPHAHVSRTKPAYSIMRLPKAVLPETGCTIGFLRQLLASTDYYQFPIVRTRQDMILSGNIVRKELERAIEIACEDESITDEKQVWFSGSFNDAEIAHMRDLNDRGEEPLSFAKYRDRYVTQVAPDAPLADVHISMAELGVRMCFVTRHGKLLGLVSKKDMIAFTDVEEEVPQRFFPL